MYNSFGYGHGDLCGSVIIYYLRGHRDATLSDVNEFVVETFHWNHDGNPRRFQGHTGGYQLLESLRGLSHLGLIVFKKDSDSISADDALDLCLSHNRANNYGEEINVIITKKFLQVQGVLGFSVTDTFMNVISRGESLTVRPFWGHPRYGFPDGIFVIMPFNDKHKTVYEDHIKKVADNLKVGCYKADDLFASSSIVTDIWSAICAARIIICDCTDRNPNVFYELGIAHTLGKEIILITQAEADVPFDIKHIRYIKYDYTPRGMKSFENTLRHYIKTSLANNEDSGEPTFVDNELFDYPYVDFNDSDEDANSK